MTSKRLARLVRLKKLVEETKVTELADKRRSLDAAAHDLDCTDEEIERLHESKLPEPTAQDLQVAARYQRHLAVRRDVQQKVVVERETEVERSREVVQDACRDRRLFEGLHERASTLEEEEHIAEERRELEAIGLSTYVRRSDKTGGSK